jgi:hypothetical protein
VVRRGGRTLIDCESRLLRDAWEGALEAALRG